MDTVHYPPDAQHLAGAVSRQLQSDGYRYHPVYYHRKGGDPSPDREANPPNAGNEQASAPLEGDPDPLRQGPGPHISRNHEGVQGSGSQPRRLLGAVDHTNAHPYRLVPGPGADFIQQARRPGWAIGKDLSIYTFCSHLCGCTFGLGLSVAGLSRIGPYQHSDSGFGVYLHLGPTKDDHDSFNGPPAAGKSDHDAVDDASADCLLFIYFSQRTGPLLDNFESHRYCHTVFYNRVATIVPAVSQSAARPRAGTAGSGHATN